MNVGWRRGLAQAMALVCIASLVGCTESGYPEPRVDMTAVAQIRGGDGGEAAEEEEEETESAGTGWGTLRGVFKYDGTPPALPPLSTAGKDAEVCGAQVPNETLVVDGATKGIANILIYARKVSRVYESEDGEEPAPQVFDQKNCLFLSHVMAVDLRRPLLIKNSDPVAHNTALSPQGNPSINPLLAAGGEVTYEFRRATNQPATATCSIHPWMKAYIIAREDPYFAVTDEHGVFEIANLPAGEEIEFQVWHELATGGLVARPEWSKGQFKVVIPEDGVEDLGEILTPAGAFK